MKTICILLLVATLCAFAALDRAIYTLQFDDSTHVRYNDGCAGANCSSTLATVAALAPTTGITHMVWADTFGCAWADDDALYCSVDDTSGVNDVYGWNWRTAGATLAVIKITGSPFDGSWAITNVNRMSAYGFAGQLHTNGWNEAGTAGTGWKATSCTSISATLYCGVARQTYGASPNVNPPNPKPAWVQSSFNASIIKSADHGVTWSNGFGVTNTSGAAPTSPNAMFPGIFGAPYPLDFGGKDGACPATDLFDCATYSYWISTDNAWNSVNSYYLGRVPKSLIGNLSAADWTFWRSGAWGAAVWGTEAQAAPIYTSAWNVSMEPMIYIPGLAKFLIVSFWYPENATGTNVATHTKWRWLECDSPAGPCASHFSDVDHATMGYYSPSIIPKWSDFAHNNLAMIYNGAYGLAASAPGSSALLTTYTIYANRLTLTAPGIFPTMGGMAR